MNIQLTTKKLVKSIKINPNKKISNYNHTYWQCRRGMLELDLFLCNFFKLHYKNLLKAEKISFNKLLQENDADLLVWFIGTATPVDRDLKNLIAKITHSLKT